MDYKTKLQACINNTQAAIDNANALPDAGGSSEIKTCDLRITVDVPFVGDSDGGVGNPGIFLYITRPLLVGK